MYNPNDFLDKSLQILNNNRIKSNSLKNHFLKNILEGEYVSQFLGYLSELEYDIEKLINYISDFQLWNNNMLQNLHESNIKEHTYLNEISRLKEALNKANDEIHNLRNQNNYTNKRNYETDIRKKLLIDEEEKNMTQADNKFNYFRNYLNSTIYKTSRRAFNDIRENNININNNTLDRLTYNRSEKNNIRSKLDDNLIPSSTNTESLIKRNDKIKDNKNKIDSINERKVKSLNKNKKISKKENNIFNKCSNKKINNRKNKNNNIKISKTLDNSSKNINNPIHRNRNININSNLPSEYPNNEDIKEFINDAQSSNKNINHNSYSNSNIINMNNNNTVKSQNLTGKIISHYSRMNTPINRINNDNFQAYPQQIYYSIPRRVNYISFNYPKKENAILFSKRMQNYIHNQNLKRRFAEINKDNSDTRQNRINNIINNISNDKNKLEELKLMFGNSIEAQILNGDLSDTYLNKIENILYYMQSNKSIIPLSKRFQIQTNSAKKNKRIYDDENDINNIKTERFFRKKLLDNKNYNKNIIKRFKTTKHFFDNKRKK